MYADEEFYKLDYYGTLVPDSELNTYLTRASDLIDQLTLYKIVKRGGIDKLTAFQQRQIKLAVCVQADYSYNSQDDTPDWVKSYSIGSVSVSKSDKLSTRFSRRSIDYLNSTGLMYRGLG